MSITSANRLELLQIAEAVAREKMIDPDLVIEAMEESMAKGARSRYGNDLDIRAHIDRKSGELTLTRVRTVVEEVEIPAAQLTVAEARALKPGAEPGDEITDEVPPVEMGRIAAQSAKQVILQKVRDAELERQFEEFKDRAGTIINGIVKREEYGNIIVDIGSAEAMLRRNDKIGRESYRNGDRIRAWIKDVRREPRGPQVFLSRTAPEFMAELFKMEVPEIYEGIIEIKAVARDPGSRAKIAVISYDSSIDPVGACVGMRGSRVQAVVNELQGEKIDIIPWSADVPTFLVNALQPAEVSKVVLDDEAERIEVVVPDEQLSLAIGRRGQNVRLASQLTGLDIDIMTEAEESERRQKEFGERSAMFMETMNLDEMVAQLLVSEGFATLGDRRLRRGHRRGVAGPRPRVPGRDQPQGARPCPRTGAQGQPRRLRGAVAADARGAGRGRHPDARGFRDLRRLGTRRRLDHRRWSARQGRGPAGEVRCRPRRGAGHGDDRAGRGRLGGCGRTGRRCRAGRGRRGRRGRRIG